MYQPATIWHGLACATHTAGMVANMPDKLLFTHSMPLTGGCKKQHNKALEYTQGMALAIQAQGFDFQETHILITCIKGIT